MHDIQCVQDLFIFITQSLLFCNMTSATLDSVEVSLLRFWLPPCQTVTHHYTTVSLLAELTNKIVEI